MGDVMGQITSKRGHVLGMDSAEGLQHLKAQVPQAEMFHYATELRSITQGRGRMFPYADRVLPEDRWAIAHHVKRLQAEGGADP